MRLTLNLTNSKIYKRYKCIISPLKMMPFSFLVQWAVCLVGLLQQMGLPFHAS
jgi:hypothetical protein